MRGFVVQWKDARTNSFQGLEIGWEGEETNTKKDVYKKTSKELYNKTKRAAKKPGRPDTKEVNNTVFKLVKAWDRRPRDFASVRSTRDENEQVLENDDCIRRKEKISLICFTWL